MKKVREGQVATSRQVESWKKEKWHLLRQIQERGVYKKELEKDRDALNCALSATKGRVETLQKHFNSAKQTGDEIQHRAKQHVIIANRTDKRRVDLLTHHHLKIAKMLAPLESSPLNLPDSVEEINRLREDVAQVSLEQTKDKHAFLVLDEEMQFLETEMNKDLVDIEVAAARWIAKERGGQQERRQPQLDRRQSEREPMMY